MDWIIDGWAAPTWSSQAPKASRALLGIRLPGRYLFFWGEEGGWRRGGWRVEGAEEAWPGAGRVRVCVGVGVHCGLLIVHPRPVRPALVYKHRRPPRPLPPSAPSPPISSSLHSSITRPSSVDNINSATVHPVANSLQLDSGLQYNQSNQSIPNPNLPKCLPRRPKVPPRPRLPPPTLPTRFVASAPALLQVHRHLTCSRT